MNTNQPQKKKSTLPYILLLVSPIPLLLLSSIMQIVARIATSDSDSAIYTVVNIFSFVVGILAILGLLLLPLWVVLLVKADKYNRSINNAPVAAPRPPES